MNNLLSILFIAILFSTCTDKNEATITGLIAAKAMVVSARVEASQIGSDIVKKGGNACAALVATAIGFSCCGTSSWT